MVIHFFIIKKFQILIIILRNFSLNSTTGQNLNDRAATYWLSHKNRPYRSVWFLASSWHWHIKRLSTPCGGQPKSQFGADYLRKNHLSQKFDELRYIENISRIPELQITRFGVVRSSKSCSEGLSGDLRLLTD